MAFIINPKSVFHHLPSLVFKGLATRLVTTAWLRGMCGAIRCGHLRKVLSFLTLTNHRAQANHRARANHRALFMECDPYKSIFHAFSLVLFCDMTQWQLDVSKAIMKEDKQPQHQPP